MIYDDETKACLHRMQKQIDDLEEENRILRSVGTKSEVLIDSIMRNVFHGTKTRIPYVTRIDSDNEEGFEDIYTIVTVTRDESKNR